MRTSYETIQFVTHFVDSVTILPFFEDLRRVKRNAAILRSLPLRQREAVIEAA